MAANLFIVISFFVYISLVNSQGRANDGPHLTMDQLIQNAAQNSRSMDFTQPDDTVLVELDMKFKKNEWEQIKRFRLDANLDPDNDRSRVGRFKRKAVRNKRWTNKEVPYLLSNIFTPENIKEVKDAMKEYHRHTCIKFRPATSRDTDKIAIQNGGGCSSFVGREGGLQGVFLAPACRKKGVIIHELGHAIGFNHEQTRPDRDQYVRIIEDNIPTRYKSNFQRFGPQVVNSLNVPYDYNSVMHYGGTTFSKNGRETIRTLDPKFQNVIGQRMGLSFRDIKLANLMYSCNARCPLKKRCPGEGFQGKNCECWCPGDPVKPCEKPAPRPTENEDCKDISSSRTCTYYKRSGYCSRSVYTGSMKRYCKKTCGFCQVSATRTCRLPQISNSRIRQQRTVIRDVWKTFQPGVEIDIGCLQRYTRVGERYLKCRSDGTWDAPTPVCNRITEFPKCDLPQIPNGRVKDDSASYDYGDYGEANDELDPANLGWLTIGARVRVECNQGYTLSGYAIIECTKDGDLTAAPRCVPDCMDSNSNCRAWASGGHCRRNPGYMLQFCKKSCNSCGRRG